MDERRQSLGEHLDELRAHVLRALLYIALATCVALLFQERLLSVVLWPQRYIAREGRADRLAEAAQDLEDVLSSVRAKPLKACTAEERAELGRRLGQAVAKINSGPDPRVAFLSPQEPFMNYLKVSFLCALFIASPLFVWELWKFVASGLHPHEQRWAKIFGPLTFACFLAGTLFGYFFLIPVSLQYLETYGSPDLLVATITLDGYLHLFLGLTFAVGLVFEVPIVVVFLSLVGIVDAAKLAAFRRYFFFIATVVGAIITPTGDPLTMSFVVLPLYGLYEIGIVSVRMIEKRKTVTA